jgi:hypothetical protein
MDIVESSPPCGCRRERQALYALPAACALPAAVKIARGSSFKISIDREVSVM